MTIGCYYQTADNLLVGLFNDDDPAAAPSGQAIATMTAAQYVEVMAGVKNDSNFTVAVSGGAVTSLTEIEDAETPETQVPLAVIDAAPWTEYEPTLIAESGTLGSYTSVGKFKQQGLLVTAKLQFVISDFGSASTGRLIATLPIAGVEDESGLTSIAVGIDGANLGLVGTQYGGAVTFNRTTGAFPGGTTPLQINLQITYEVPPD